MPATPLIEAKGRSKARRAPTAMRIEKGLKVVCQERAAQVLTIVSPTQIWVSFLGTQEHAWVSAEALTPYVEPASTEPAKAVVPIEDEFEYERATQWVEQFDRFEGGGVLTPEDKATIGDAMEASRRTVERHFDSYQLDPSPRGQLPNKPGPERGQSTLQPAIVAIIDKAIDEKYLNAERGSVQGVVDLARLRSHSAGLALPCYNTVLARIKKLDRWKTARIRHGCVRGDAMAGPAGEGLKGLQALDFVQMDHAIVDLIVVDPDTREDIGRPWITLAIDVATRCVMGFYLSFDPPSQTSVALALEQCCCPKDAWLKEIGFDGEWMPFGLMKRIGWDNAKCFKNTRLIQGCQSAGIQPQFRRVRTPVHGAHIERFIGTYMGKIHLLKGTTFSNTKEREDYNSGARAVMSLKELTLWTVHQINGCYHNTRHSGLNKTPLEAWDAALRHDGQLRLPPMPADRRKFKLSLLPGVMRSVSREGMKCFGLTYWDEALIPFIGDRKKYFLAHDIRDISRTFLEYEGEYLDVPWSDRTRRPVSLFQWKRAQRATRKEHNAPVSEATVFKHLEAQYEIEDKAEKTTRQQRRDRQRRPTDNRPPRASTQIDYLAAPTLTADPLEDRHGPAR